ncbi:helix-turn-helix domain-containing protein [Bacillus sp. FJAT-49705]|uniref:Helix-turn-helix domain-containing protein n=1 Tax=Cytobacillus citreus TaxID=2833586 RepID=A0ABS5NNC4_9BACI|nr:RodZ domain-containing protein [Cytobacillus citreus]MBS4189302.1 helix-turn-helix domain-containing protein [Cytobacillus citreus]
MTELGNRLKEARLAKNMSLDDLQVATKIQKRYLIGIEEGNYSMMPGQFYVRAFIKQYAEAVGLQPEEIFEQYKSDIPSTINEDIPEKISRVQSRKNISSGNSKVFDILPKLLIALFVIGAAAALWYFYIQKDSNDSGIDTSDNKGNEEVKIEVSKDFAKDSDKKTKENETIEEDNSSKDEVTEETEVEPPKQEISVAESSGRKTVYELGNADKFELKVASTGETWVSIANEKGASFFQGTLTKGGNESQTFDFSNETEAVIKVGKSTETEIYINEEKIKFAIDPAQSVTQEITIRYLPSNE